MRYGYVMIGEWVKMRVWIFKDPQVLSMADYLRQDECFNRWAISQVNMTCCESATGYVTNDVTVRIVVTGLLQAWGVACERGHASGDDLVLSPCAIHHFDEITGIPMFGDAMESVGWLRCDEDDHGNSTVILPKFMRYNVPAEDRQKKQSAERQKRYRERKKAEREASQSIQ